MDKEKKAKKQYVQSPSNMVLSRNWRPFRGYNEVRVQGI
jgi:hypothetical protein